MAIHTILHYPDPRLRNKGIIVAKVDDAIKALITDMFETMYYDNGLGLAATQININKRIFVCDLSDNKSQQFCFINPEILSRDGIEETQEGCLSVPGIYEKVQRAKHVKVRALNREGKAFELAADGLLAVCIQHEIDHLDGKLFVDYLSKLKRERIGKKLEKLRHHIL